jgi:hypothetical protein
MPVTTVPTKKAPKTVPKAAPFKDKKAKHKREESTESLGEAEYGSGWDQVFDTAPTNVTELQLRQT